MFKFKMTPDRHNAIQNLNYYLRPDPPLFSLPSTFKEMLAGGGGGGGLELNKTTAKKCGSLSICFLEFKETEIYIFYILCHFTCDEK